MQLKRRKKRRKANKAVLSFCKTFYHYFGISFEKLSGFNRVGAKSRFSVSDRPKAFAIAGIKQREHLVASISLQKR